MSPQERQANLNGRDRKISKQTNRKTDNQANKQTDKQTNRQTDEQTTLRIEDWNELSNFNN
jgi:hypothetical protein